MPTLVEMRSRFRPEDPFSPAFDSLFTQPWLRAVPRRLVARWRDEMAFQVGRRAGVADSDANFVLFGPLAEREKVWQGLLDRGVLIRVVGPPGWLRVSIGTAAEMAAFRAALQEVLGL